MRHVGAKRGREHKDTLAKVLATNLANAEIADADDKQREDQFGGRKDVWSKEANECVESMQATLRHLRQENDVRKGIKANISRNTKMLPENMVDCICGYEFGGISMCACDLEKRAKSIGLGEGFGCLPQVLQNKAADTMQRLLELNGNDAEIVRKELKRLKSDVDARVVGYSGVRAEASLDIPFGKLDVKILDKDYNHARAELGLGRYGISRYAHMLKVLSTIRPVFKDRLTTEMQAITDYMDPHVPVTLPDDWVLPSPVVMATPEPVDEPADDKMVKVDLEAEDSEEDEEVDSGLDHGSADEDTLGEGPIVMRPEDEKTAEEVNGEPQLARG